MIVQKTVCDICRTEKDLAVYRFDNMTAGRMCEVGLVHLCPDCQKRILQYIYKERSAHVVTGRSES